MNVDPNAMKYLITANIIADGIVEKPDVVGAIFGQTEGLLGEELDLRDLQKGGRIGRIEVEISSKKGRSEGKVLVPSSLDQVETCILASALETIDRVGPCHAQIGVDNIEDVRVSKRKKIIERARELLNRMVTDSKGIGIDLTDSVRQSVQMEEITAWGKDRLPAGPNIDNSDAIIIVEGRSDVLNLLRSGIRNVIAVEGTKIPQSVIDLCQQKSVTAFFDGDRGGELILRELMQVAEIDHIATAPDGKEVEELTGKQIMKALRYKVSFDQFIDTKGWDKNGERKEGKDSQKPHDGKREDRKPIPQPPRSHPSRREEAPAPAPVVEEGKHLSEEHKKFHNILRELDGSRQAVFLITSGEATPKLPVAELTKALQTSNDVKAIIFDGIVTQSLVEVAAGVGVKDIVAFKLGSITKKPAEMNLWTAEDFQ